MGNEYSSLKMVRWALKEGFPPKAPKQVQVILSDLCNQDCSFCAYRMTAGTKYGGEEGGTSTQLFTRDAALSKYGHNNPQRWMPTERAMHLLREMSDAGVLGIQFTGGGEPTVHPDHEALFFRCMELGMRASLVSNGVRWSEMLTKEILPNFSWVRVSVDAGTPETYIKTRNTTSSAWNRVWVNIETLSTKILSKRSDCVLGVGYVVTPDNWREIVEGCKLAKNAGAHYIRMSALFSPEDEKPYLDIYPEITENIEQAKHELEDDRFTIHNLFGERVEDLIQGRPEYKRCAYQSFVSYIGADLTAYRCCVYSYNQRGKIAGGDLKERRFDEFWSSPERRKDFEEFDARGCERCQFNPKNRAMEYVLADKQVHEEFP